MHRYREPCSAIGQLKQSVSISFHFGANRRKMVETVERFNHGIHDLHSALLFEGCLKDKGLECKVRYARSFILIGRISISIS